MIESILKLIFALLFVASASTASASETVKGAKKDFETFKAEMSEKLDAVEMELIELRKKAKDKGSAVKEESLRELQETRDRLKSELNEMESKGKQNWQKFKKGFAESVDRLNNKVQESLRE